jgi:hypothetical protein
MRRILRSRDLRLANLVFATVSLGLLLALLVAAYGVLVPFFAALAATPLILALLSLGAVGQAN